MSSGERYSMVQECTDRYQAQKSEAGDLQITIQVPRQFADLWLVKLSSLQTTDAEIAEYAPSSDGLANAP